MGLYGQREEKETIELSKPEILRAMDKFQNACFSTSETKDGLEHPESSTCAQKKFLNYLEALCNLVNKGTVLNLLKQSGTELINMDTARLWI